MSAFLSFSRQCANERSETLVSVTPASPAPGEGPADICQSHRHRDSTCWGCWGWGSAPAPGLLHLPELGGNGLTSAENLPQLKSQLLIEYNNQKFCSYSI